MPARTVFLFLATVYWPLKVRGTTINWNGLKGHAVYWLHRTQLPITILVLLVLPITSFFLKITTQCQDEVRILSGRTQKLKVAKQCCKQLNEHNLMYIYHKQCENMQKIQWKSSNGQIQCFMQATSGALCWKPQKHAKQEKLKLELLKIFQ